MQPETPDSHSIEPPAVREEIPSAVRSGSPWSTTALLLIAVLGILVIFLLKGGARKSNANDELAARGTTELSLPAVSLPSLQALPHMPAVGAPPNEEARALREVRRNSPIVIFNNTPATAAAPNPVTDSLASSVPMPSGFHPSAASNSKSNTLGDREFIIAQGKLIDAVLETAINTDQPGLLRALVSQDIYGDNGRTVLLARGSRLIGEYNADIAQGQNRVFVIWKRVIRPDGIDMTLDSGATDPLGEAGVNGKVNRHFLSMFGAATLLSIIGASASTVGVGPQDNNNSLSSYRSSVSQGFNEAGNTVLGVFVRIKPTITVQQGTAIKVLVARDLYFDPAALADHRLQVLP
jgi:type IV secretion system protein VirB10